MVRVTIYLQPKSPNSRSSNSRNSSNTRSHRIPRTFVFFIRNYFYRQNFIISTEVIEPTKKRKQSSPSLCYKLDAIDRLRSGKSQANVCRSSLSQITHTTCNVFVVKTMTWYGDETRELGIPAFLENTKWLLPCFFTISIIISITRINY